MFTPTSHTHTRAVFIALTLFASHFLLPQARAQYTWIGLSGSSSNWSDSANWDPVPGYGTLIFTGTTQTTNTVDANYNENQLQWGDSSAWILISSSGAVVSLFDNGGTQAKVESLGTGGVTINAPITFAATAGNNWGEVNAVSSNITFGGGTLTVSGSSVYGIKFWGGSPNSVTFNNTVNASGKWFATTGSGAVRVGATGNVTTGDIYLMNGASMEIASGGALSAPAIRMGGDFGATGNQDQTKGATLSFTGVSGGQGFDGIINTTSGNTSQSLLIDSQNTSNTNTLSGNIFLDSNLNIQQASGGTLAITGTIANGQSLTCNGSGTLVLEAANSFSGDTIVNSGTLAFAAGGSSDNSAIRLGGTAGSANATVVLASTSGGQTIASLINPRFGSSGTRAIASLNSSGTNTISGSIYLDDSLTVQNDSGSTLVLNGATIDVKSKTLFINAAGTVSVTTPISSTSNSGTLIKQGAGVLVVSGSSSFGGSTYVDEGTIESASNGTALGATDGVTTGVVGLGPQYVAANTSLTLTAPDASLVNPINVRYFGLTDTKTIGSTNTSGTATYSGLIILNDSVTLTAAAGGTTLFSGGIIVGTATNSQTVNGTPGVTVNAAGGTVVLSGSQNYGALNASTGTVELTSNLITLASLNIATSGTAVLTEHSGGPANVKVMDISSLTISGTTPFVGDGGKDGSGLASPAPVPEPGTIGLLAVGAIGGAILLRRSRRNGAE